MAFSSLEAPRGAPLYSSDVAITFPTSAKSALTCSVMDVDDELQPTKICKTFTHDGPILRVAFVSTDPKVLRVALSSFYDMLAISLKTLQEFDDEEEEKAKGADDR